jgi:predicted nucleotidyltransferase
MKRQSIDLSSPRIRAWKILFNVENVAPLAHELAKLTNARGIGIYGSLARGEDMPESDVDIWVKVDRYPEAVALAKARDFLRHKLGRAVSLLILTPEKLTLLHSSDPSLYFSLIHSFHLWGERVD